MERINPAVKTVMLLILGLALSFSYKVSVNLALTVFCILLLLFSKADKKRAFTIYAGAVLIALSLFFTAVWFGKGSDAGAVISTDFATAVAGSHSIYGGLQLAARILAYAGIGILFAFTTDGDELMSSFIHQLKMPPKYAYGILAAYHFAGNIKEEYNKVNLAFRIRGISTGRFSFQQLFVMLVNALHWSGDIAAAMESKGFDGNEKRSYYRIPRIGKIDYIFIICVGVSMIIFIF